MLIVKLFLFRATDRVAARAKPQKTVRHSSEPPIRAGGGVDRRGRTLENKTKNF